MNSNYLKDHFSLEFNRRFNNFFFRTSVLKNFNKREIKFQIFWMASIPPSSRYTSSRRWLFLWRNKSDHIFVFILGTKFTQSCFLSLSLSFSLTHTHTNTLSHTHTLKCTFYFSYTPFHSLSLSRTYRSTQSLSTHPFSLSLSLSLSLSHTHTHTFFISVSWQWCTH